MPEQVDTELKSNFELGGYGDDVVVEEKKETRESTMKAVILAGGFGKRLVHDIAEFHRSKESQLGATGHGGDARTMGMYVKELRGGVGEERIPEVLLDLDDIDVLEYWTLVLRQCERLWPLENNLYIVCNERDYEEFMEWADPDVSGTAFNQANIISNGCKSSADWQGDVSDLKLAIEHFGITQSVTALPGASICYPDFNFSRIIEHSIIRNKDVLCYQEAADAQLSLDAKETLSVCNISGGSSVPYIESFTQKVAVRGDKVAQNMAVLKASSIPDIMASEARTVAGMMIEFSGKKPICGINMGWGFFKLDTLKWLNYAHSFFIQFGIMKKAASMAGKTQDTVSSIKFGTEVQTITRVAEAIREAMNDEIIRQFDQDYFGSGATNYQSAMSYKIPSTFYQTNYRRQIEFAGKKGAL